MKVAVTGATGFLGRHVLAELSSREIKTVVAVRDSASCAEFSHFHACVVMDIHTPACNAYDVLQKPDVLIHLAWAGLPNYKSLHHFTTELPLQYQFLRSLVEQGLPSLVSAGTCFEYGMQNGALGAEMETRPTTPYGFAKDALRKQLQFLQADHSFKLTWARLFYMYGAGQAENSLYPSLQRAVSEGQDSFPMSGGEQLRDFLPVEMVAKTLVNAVCSPPVEDVINICSGSPVSVRRLVEDWKKQYGWQIDLDLGRYPYPDYEAFAFWGVP